MHDIVQIDGRTYALDKIAGKNAKDLPGIPPENSSVSSEKTMAHLLKQLIGFLRMDIKSLFPLSKNPVQTEKNHR